MTIGKVERDDWPTCLARLAANIAKPNLGYSGRVVLSIRAGGASRNEQRPTDRSMEIVAQRSCGL